MNAEMLLEQYERIADAPDAVERLRRFVLDLAIRGKLVTHRDADEPADMLVNRIRAEVSRLIDVGSMRRPKPIPAHWDPPFTLPTNWRWSQIAELGILNPRNEAEDHTDASFVPMPLIAAEYGKKNTHEVRVWKEVKSGYTHFAEGDVGLAKITPCFENGKSTVFENLTGGFGSGTTELHILRPVIVDARYVLIFLKSPHFIESGIPRMTGTAGQKRVPSEYFANSPFPLPPLAEQHRIVAKVDELMALCDQLEAARAKREATRDRLAATSLARLNAPDPDTFKADVRFALDALPQLTARSDQIKQLRQTILDLAVTGKLFVQNITDKPLGAALTPASFDVTPTTSKNNVEPSRADLPSQSIEEGALPQSWEMTTLGQKALTMRYGTSLKCEKDVDGTPVLRIPNVSGGIVNLDNLKYGDLTPSEANDLALEVGDLLLIRSNGSLGLVGRAAVATTSVQGMSFAGYLVRVRFNSAEVSAEYVKLALDSTSVRDQIELPIRSAVGLKNVNLTEFRALKFAIPALSEQISIVFRVQQLMASCDQLEFGLKKFHALRSQLLDALLRHTLDESVTA